MIDQKKIGEIGMLKIKRTGITPIEVSRSIVRVQWDQIDEESKKELVTIGIASLLNGLLQQERAKAESYSQRYDRQDQNMLHDIQRKKKEEVNRIHTKINCQFSTHNHSYSKRYDCVSHLLGLTKEEQEEKIAELKKENDQWAEDRRKSEQESWNRINKMFQDAVDRVSEHKAIDLLKSITLQSKDGSMQTLLDFSLDDLDKWERNSRAKSQGWKIREKWFRKTRLLLEQHGASRIGDLPSNVVIMVAEGARRIWKRERDRAHA